MHTRVRGWEAASASQGWPGIVRPVSAAASESPSINPASQARHSHGRERAPLNGRHSWSKHFQLCVDRGTTLPTLFPNLKTNNKTEQQQKYLTSMVRLTVSPGMTISVPSGSWTEPVTSAVRTKNCGLWGSTVRRRGGVGSPRPNGGGRRTTKIVSVQQDTACSMPG